MAKKKSKKKSKKVTSKPKHKSKTKAAKKPAKLGSKQAKSRKTSSRKAASPKSSLKATSKKSRKSKVASTKASLSVTAESSKAPQVGEFVPDFELASTAGPTFRLSDFKGKKVILYFYPKDATPGCTIEGHDFSNLLEKFKEKNAEVFGISRDSLASHEKFKANQCYSVELLSDPDERACKIFDVIKEKNMYGKMVLGIERSTFLIDEEGRLSNEWRKVKVEGHAQEVLTRV